MDIAVSGLTVVAAVAAFLLAPMLMLLVDAWWGRRRPRSVWQALAIAAVAALCWLAVVAITDPELEPLLVLPLAGLAGAAAALATVALRGRSTVVILGFAAVWTLAVFAPVAIAVLSVTDGLIGSTLRTLDLGAALPALVASGCAGWAILVVERRSRGEPLDPPRAIVAPVFALVWVLWTLWLVGSELVLDEATPAIVASAIIGPVASAVVWLIVQRVRHAKTTVLGAVGGLFCGLVAVTAGCGYLNPLGAAITGGVAGAVCSLLVYRAVRRSGKPAWLLVVVLVGAASVGIVLLGALATRSGLMFTGQPEVLFGQFASVAVVVVYSFAVSLLLWLGVRAAASALEARRKDSTRA